jgi:hypothetical protein
MDIHEIQSLRILRTYLLCHVRFNLDRTCLTKILHEDLHACLHYLILFIGEKYVLNKRCGEKYSLENVRASTSHNPMGLHGLLRDSYTFYLTSCVCYENSLLFVCLCVCAPLHFWGLWNRLALCMSTLSLLGNGPSTCLCPLLIFSFSMWSVSYERKVGVYFFPELLVSYAFVARYSLKKLKIYM